mmetsp:Transcript_8668/g.9922  ORF Transcript_8668/g.9922 Transcript_8668/m.9922 type:complete len:459 (-) Transcript_8668:406-1782(-)|eukprot:CAMPEP_0184015156 /NCGR_PEP_ID=MMETSP0954-20121128/6133_1 /TAXON_ID=627963 /ORGANISM="Aplanochytrium sp, Strain PBS07" /LENGTH=458 /DNA_ID=CAMNT_0026295867 /DNA_START=105 /DNA_END=1481 /DNA_ORIENTATION=-
MLTSTKAIRSLASAAKTSSRTFATITDVKGREVIDSRGNPTVEVDVFAGNNLFRAMVPSGASTGAYEACELRDGGSRYNGKGVQNAVNFVNTELKEAVMGMDVVDQEAIDKKMLDLDGTANKSRLGANAILGISLAVSEAGAVAKNVPLWKHYADLAGNDRSTYTMPVPCFNVINGGEHAGNKLAFQEFFMIPTRAETFKEAMQIGCECFHSLKSVIKGKYGGDATLIGDEGGFAPPVDATEGLELLMQAIKIAGHDGKVDVGLDVASSEFKVAGEDKYDLDFKTTGADKDLSMTLTGEQLADYYAELCNKFPIITIEDPFDQDDWANWIKITERIGGPVQIVGDDLTVTNMEIIQRAVNEKACNGLLLKVNQIGSVMESIGAVKLAQESGWGVMTSHRSGETEDTKIADIAVGLSTGTIKTGAPCRGERTAKYNQLLRIEEAFAPGDVVYAGANFRK